jgi:hypothetical protein
MTSGDEQLVWYQSSPPARRGFCGRCGSTLFFESTRWRDEIHIALAHMDGPIDRAPAAHVFFDAHVSWFEPSDGLRRLGGASGNQELDRD